MRTILLFIALGVSVARAELPADVAKAAAETEQVLTDPALRAKAIQGDPKAQAADRNVSQLAGSPENAEEIYLLAAEIFGDLVTRAGGDPDKMMDMMKQAEKDPSAFAVTLTPTQKQRLSEIAKKVEKTQGSKLP